MVRKTAPSHRGAGQQPGIKRLEHAAISHYLLALAVDVNAPLDLTRIIAKSRKLKPVADLDGASENIKDLTVPVGSLEELRALWSWTFPSLATAATMSLVLEIPDPIPEVPAPSGPPSALLPTLQPTQEGEQLAAADLLFSFDDSPPPSPNREMGLLRRQLEEATKEKAMDSDTFCQFLGPLMAPKEG